MTHTPSVCPVHLYERNRCSFECMDARVAFKRSAQALRVYWHQRRQGTRPRFEYQMRFVR